MLLWVLETLPHFVLTNDWSTPSVQYRNFQHRAGNFWIATQQTDFTWFKGLLPNSGLLLLIDKQQMIFSSLTFFRSFVSYLTASLNVNVMLVIFYHDISEMLFAIIFPLSLPLLSINTNRRDRLLASHMKETQTMIRFI